MNRDETSDRLLPFGGDLPSVDPSAWIGPGAKVIGNVTIGPEVGVFYNAVLRAEGASIRIGARSNVQDNCVMHAGLEHAITVGSGVVVGHSAILHGCEVEDDVLIGMGAILLNGCVIGRGSFVAAGALVSEGARIPPGSLVVGRPGRVRRVLSAAEQAEIRAGADHYVELLRGHRGAEE